MNEKIEIHGLVERLDALGDIAPVPVTRSGIVRADLARILSEDDWRRIETFQHGAMNPELLSPDAAILNCLNAVFVTEIAGLRNPDLRASLRPYVTSERRMLAHFRALVRADREANAALAEAARNMAAGAGDAHAEPDREAA